MPTPNEIMESAYEQAQKESLQKLLSGLPTLCNAQAVVLR